MDDQQDAAQRIAEGRELLNEGYNLARERSYQQAQQLYTQAVEIFEQHAPGTWELAHGYYGLGEVHLYQKDYDQAIVESQKAVTIFEQLAPTSVELASSYQVLGNSYRFLDEKDQCIVYIKKAIKILKLRQPRSIALGERYRELAHTYFGQHDMDHCIVYVNKAIKIFKDHDPSYSLSFSYELMGMAHWSRGNCATAIAAYKQALESIETLEPPDIDRALSDLSITNCKMAAAYLGLGNYDAAIFHAEKAIKIWQHTHPEPMFWMADCYCNLGHSLCLKGNLDEAMASYVRVIDIHEQNAFESPPMVADCFRGAAAVLRMQGKYDQAVVHACKAISMYDIPAPDPEGRAESYKVAGDVCRDSHTYGAAMFCYREAAQILEQKGKSVGIELYRSLGLTVSMLWKHCSESMERLVRDLLSLE